MTAKRTDAIALVESLGDAELNQLAVGHRHLVYAQGRFQLAEPGQDQSHALFEGGQDWLERRVPHQDRKGEELRQYILEYIDEVFDYVTANW